MRDVRVADRIYWGKAPVDYLYCPEKEIVYFGIHGLIEAAQREVLKSEVATPYFTGREHFWRQFDVARGDDASDDVYLSQFNLEDGLDVLLRKRYIDRATHDTILEYIEEIPTPKPNTRQPSLRGRAFGIDSPSASFEEGRLKVSLPEGGHSRGHSRGHSMVPLRKGHSMVPQNLSSKGKEEEDSSFEQPNEEEEEEEEEAEEEAKAEEEAEEEAKAEEEEEEDTEDATKKRKRDGGAYKEKFRMIKALCMTLDPSYQIYPDERARARTQLAILNMVRSLPMHELAAARNDDDMIDDSPLITVSARIQELGYRLPENAEDRRAVLIGVGQQASYKYAQENGGAYPPRVLRQNQQGEPYFVTRWTLDTLRYLDSAIKWIFQ